MINLIVFFPIIPSVSVSLVLCERRHYHPAAAATTSSFATNSSGCAKCGTTKKSGKRSCCARGGAWFKNCGDAGDTKFDYTWTEGIQACAAFATLVTAKSSLHVMLHHVGVITHSLKISHSRHADQKQTNISRPKRMPNAVSTEAEGNVAVVSFCFVYILAFL